MSEIIYNPYRNINWDSINYYKGNMHCHSIRDYDEHGRDKPNEIVDEYSLETSDYRSHGSYDVLALTEHDHRILEERVSYPWIEFSQIDLDYSEKVPVPYEDRNPENISMVSISGLEVGLPHQIQLFTDFTGASIEGDSIQHSEWYPSFKESAEVVIDEKEGFLSLAHPNPVLFNPIRQDIADVYRNYSITEVGIECRNASYDDRGQNEWDNLLSNIMSSWRYGKPFVGFGSDDRHSMTQTSAFAGYNIFLTEELKKESIENCIRKGSFFWIYNPDKVEINTNLYPKVNVSKEIIDLNIEGSYTNIEWISEENIVLENSEIINVKDLGLKKYVRAIIYYGDIEIGTQVFGIINRDWKDNFNWR